MYWHYRLNIAPCRFSKIGYKLMYTVVLIRDQTRSVAKQVSVAVGWVKIKISLMAQLKGLTAKFKLM